MIGFEEAEAAFEGMRALAGDLVPEPQLVPRPHRQSESYRAHLRPGLIGEARIDVPPKPGPCSHGVHAGGGQPFEKGFLGRGGIGMGRSWIELQGEAQDIRLREAEAAALALEPDPGYRAKAWSLSALDMASDNARNEILGVPDDRQWNYIIIHDSRGIAGGERELNAAWDREYARQGLPTPRGAGYHFVINNGNDIRLWEYSVLVSNTTHGLEAMGQLYRDRADCDLLLSAVLSAT